MELELTLRQAPDDVFPHGCNVLASRWEDHLVVLYRKGATRAEVVAVVARDLADG